MVSLIQPRVGRKRINAPEARITARFAEGVMDRIKSALRKGESQSEFIRVAVENEIERRRQK